MSKKKITVGIIGNGKSTNRYHLPYLLQRQDIYCVKTIYEGDLNCCQRPRVAGICYTNLVEDIMDDPEITLVIINTPINSHEEYALRAMDAGKSVVLETPFALTSIQVESLFQYAKDKGVILQAFQNRRYDSDFLTVKSMIDSGILGELYEMELCFDYYRTKVIESLRHNINKTFLYEHGAHSVDQVVSLFGEPEHVEYDVKQLLGKGRFNDFYDIDMHYGSLKVSVKASYFRAKARPRFIVTGRNGVFIKENGDRQEDHLKLGYMPGNKDFGQDRIEDYGTVYYYDHMENYHEEKVRTAIGDYGRYYDNLYRYINGTDTCPVKPEETILLYRILEEGLQRLQN